MATYQELRDRFGSGVLGSKIDVAVIIKAHAILQEASPSASRKAFAVGVFMGFTEESKRMLLYLLASNKDLTPAQLDGATDAAVQSKVDEAINKIYP